MPENDKPIDSFLAEIEAERLEVREELVSAGMENEVKAIEKAVDKAAEDVKKQNLERETNRNVRFPNQELGVSKDPRFAPSPRPADVPVPVEFEVEEVIVLPSSPSVEDCSALTEAAKGRLESDIPMDDDYWKVRNRILQGMK